MSKCFGCRIEITLKSSFDKIVYEMFVCQRINTADSFPRDVNFKNILKIACRERILQTQIFFFAIRQNVKNL